jgi:hypothetical protein
MKGRGLAILIGSVAGFVFVIGLWVLSWPKNSHPELDYIGPPEPAGYVEIEGAPHSSMLLAAISDKGYRNYWVRDEMPEDDGDQRLESKRTLIEYDCGEQRYRLREIERFAGPNLTKRYYRADVSGSDWEYPRRYSHDEYFLAFACDGRQPVWDVSPSTPGLR